MLNLLVQLLTLINGLMFNFLAPAAYGLAIYGEFIGINALVFLIHRSMGIISEPLIRFTKPETLIYSSMALHGIVFVVFLPLSVMASIGSPLLLFTMLLSSSVLLTLQALRMRRAYIAFLVTTCTAFLLLLFGPRLLSYSLPLEQLMEFSTGIPAFIWLGVVLMHSDAQPRGQELVESLRALARQVPTLLSMTAVMNLFTSALPVFLARTLVPYDLGLFKVMSSVIQSATSLFPVSTQALLSSFVRHTRSHDVYAVLKNAALLYFAAAAAGLIVVAMLIPALKPYMALICCLPIYYRAILAERHLTAAHRIATLVIINLLIVMLALYLLPGVQTIESAALLYTSGFVVYAMLLSLAERSLRDLIPDLIIMAACPLAIIAMAQHLWVGLLYLGVLVAVELLQRRPSRDGISLLWREL